jgi:hypothetical protein
MATKSPLPANWTLILDEIQRALTQAVQLAEAREAALVAILDGKSSIASASLLPPELLAPHLEALETRVHHMETPLAALDRNLEAEEEGVRQHLAKVADLRHRLADWAGRAIR